MRMANDAVVDHTHQFSVYENNFVIRKVKKLLSHCQHTYTNSK
jgi:hypothetical protein